MYMLFLEQTTTDSTTGKTSSDRDIKLDNGPFNPVKHKLFNENKFQSSPPGKKTCLSTTGDCVLTGFDMPVVRTEWPGYRYFPVDEEWQRNACKQLGLRFLKSIGGDGNCL